MEDLERRLMAVTIISLKQFPSKELAALNVAISFGNVSKKNCAYARALESALIHQDGSAAAIYELKSAMAIVINQRIEEGTFA